MFGLYARLAAAAVIAMALAAGAWKCYSAGKAAVRAEWQADIAERTAQALVASEKARAREQELSATINTVRGQYAKQVQNLHVVAGAAADGMRELQTALAGPAAAASASATARADDAARARLVVGRCAQTVQGLAALLDQREQQLIGLQGYVTAIQPKP